MIWGDPPFEENQNEFSSSCSKKCKQTTVILVPAYPCSDVIASDKPCQDEEHDETVVDLLMNWHSVSQRKWQNCLVDKAMMGAIRQWTQNRFRCSFNDSQISEIEGSSRSRSRLHQCRKWRGYKLGWFTALGKWNLPKKLTAWSCLKLKRQPVNGVVGLVFACHLGGVSLNLGHSIEGSEVCISGDRSSLSTWFGSHVKLLVLLLNNHWFHAT